MKLTKQMNCCWAGEACFVDDAWAEEELGDMVPDSSEWVEEGSGQFVASESISMGCTKMGCWVDGEDNLLDRKSGADVAQLDDTYGQLSWAPLEELLDWPLGLLQER
ncbi:hypothetical protein L1987_18484 [Smallanthus sonchifolius]|uniref:Uncharacterized protein n=1 Tax=Smallanthus sonchifolius TaxID=185202 RepID=A0ACB9J0X2_9ASTR|nr:hypothetical protein L1987_18484 [Smallanthus sonchifolius]